MRRRRRARSRAHTVLGVDNVGERGSKRVLRRGLCSMDEVWNVTRLVADVLEQALVASGLDRVSLRNADCDH